MSSVSSVAATLQQVLTDVADAAGRSSGCIQRQGKFTGASLCQTLIFGWLGNPRASLGMLCQMAAACGVTVSPQGLDQRFTLRLARCLEVVLQAAIGQMIQAPPRAAALLDRFPEVVIRDTTTITLPGALAAVWSGCGDATADGHTAVLKLGVGVYLRRGRLLGPILAHGRMHDRVVTAQHGPLPPGALLLQDLGHFSLDAFAAYHAAGIALLSRLQAGTRVYQPDGTPIDLVRVLRRAGPTLDCPVLVGAKRQLPMRLIAARVPDAVANQRRRRMREEARRRQQPLTAERRALAAWTILVTTVPTGRLSVEEALVLARARWQIELLFKCWKAEGLVDQWRTQKAERILCEVYAKLIALVIQHWLFLLGPFAAVTTSLTKATRAVQAGSQHLAFSCRSPRRCAAALREIVTCAAAGCRINPRKRRPAAYQCWLDPSLGGYA